VGDHQWLAALRPGHLIVQLRPAAGPEWVVCLGELRDIERDRVQCPLTESAVSVADCLACRHLAGVADERDSSEWCKTSEFELRR
jgi:hypothetical protein